MNGPGSKSGWRAVSRRRQHGDFAPIVTPSAWDKLLAEMELTSDDQALAMIGSMRLRAFVRRCYRKRFIPEAVLEAIGIPESAVLETRLTRGNRKRFAGAA